MLRKPRSLRIGEFIRRLRTINRYLPDFPSPDNSSLDEDAMVDIIVQVIPMKWKTELVREQYDPGQHTIVELEGRLEMLEVGEDLEKASPKVSKPGNGESSDKTSDKSASKHTKTHEKNGKARFAKKKFSDKPPCQLCAILGGNAESHSTKNCFKKAAMDKRSDVTKAKRKWVSHEEVNALVLSRTKKSLKRAFKKNDLQYKSSTSESSDTES